MISTSKTAKCPCCGEISNKRHSKKIQNIHDISNEGLITIQLTYNQYTCTNDKCKKEVFNETFSFLDFTSRRTIMLDQFIMALTYELTVSGTSKILKLMNYDISTTSINRILNNITIDKFQLQNEPITELKISYIPLAKIAAYLPLDIGIKFKEWFLGNKKVEIVTNHNSQIYSDGIIKQLKRITLIKNKYQLLETLLKLVGKVVAKVKPAYQLISSEEPANINHSSIMGKSEKRQFYNYKTGTYVESSGKTKKSIHHKIL